jgi:hypothetical protein
MEIIEEREFGVEREERGQSHVGGTYTCSRHAAENHERANTLDGVDCTGSAVTV